MKTLFLSLLLVFTLSISVFSQDIHINSTNYHEFLDLEKWTLRDSIASNLSLTLKQSYNSKQDTRELICQEFKVKNSSVNNVTFVYNEYTNATSLLSLGFMTFTVKTPKQADKLYEAEQKKQYKNFTLKVLTKYFLVRNGQKFIVIFTETPRHPMLEQLFYP